MVYPERPLSKSTWLNKKGASMTSERQRVASGSPYEEAYGFCRAVRVGDRVIVAGTAPIWPDGSCDPDPAVQARRCLDIIAAALAEAGSGQAEGYGLYGELPADPVRLLGQDHAPAELECSQRAGHTADPGTHDENIRLRFACRHAGSSTALLPRATRWFPVIVTDRSRKPPGRGGGPGGHGLADWTGRRG